MSMHDVTRLIRRQIPEDTKPAQYNVRLTDEQGRVSYLSHRDRIAWGKRQAQQHAADWRKNHPGYTAEVVTA